MDSKIKPSFTRLFLGGFALGAVTLVSVQAAQASPTLVVAPAHAATR